MALALYRSHRPRRFADLVGQTEVAETLRAQVASGGLAHAYLFSGIRGTGKTSTARIMAQAVNCLDLKDGEPCGACTACVQIQAGGAMDVLEIDAASNRGIDEMRDLRDRVKFLPAELKRKVYIVDEAHMLTTEAWNAFLKTLEEPPAHVLFILCTTEAHKLPDTARSRLQRFDFRRVSVQELAAHLGSIAKIEGAEVAPEALTLMARSAQGSVRDAVSLLDQALSRPERPLSLATTRMALGLADPEMTSRLVRAVGTADPGEALRAVAQLFEGGCDPRQALHDCARLARAAELCALGCEDAADVDAQELPLCKALAELHPKDGFWVDATERLALAEQDLRQPVDPRLQVEVTVLRLVDEAHRLELGLPTIATLHDQVQELRRQMGELRANPVTASTATLPLPAVTAPGAAQLPRPAAPVVAAAPASAPPPHPALPPANPVDPNQWADLIRKVSSHNMRLGAVLRSCRATLNPAGRLTIAASPGFHMDQLQDPAHQQTIATALREVIGKDCQVSVTPRPAAAHQVGGLGG